MGQKEEGLSLHRAGDPSLGQGPRAEPKKSPAARGLAKGIAKTIPMRPPLAREAEPQEAWPGVQKPAPDGKGLAAPDRKHPAHPHRPRLSAAKKASTGRVFKTSSASAQPRRRVRTPYSRKSRCSGA